MLWRGLWLSFLKIPFNLVLVGLFSLSSTNSAVLLLAQQTYPIYCCALNLSSRTQPHLTFVVRVICPPCFRNYDQNKHGLNAEERCVYALRKTRQKRNNWCLKVAVFIMTIFIGNHMTIGQFPGTVGRLMQVYSKNALHFVRRCNESSWDLVESTHKVLKKICWISRVTNMFCKCSLYVLEEYQIRIRSQLFSFCWFSPYTLQPNHL